MHRSVPQKIVAVVLACSPVLFTGCDLPLDFWDTKTITVDIPANTVVTFPPQHGDVDLSTDPAISSHLNQIQSLAIPEIWVQVGQVYPDNVAASVSGTLTISDPSDSTWTPITLTYTDIPIAAGGQLNLTPDPTDVTRLQDLVQKKQKFDAVYSGSINGASTDGGPAGPATPAHFDLTGRIHITATVST